MMISDSALYHDILAHLRQAEPQEVGLQPEDVFGALTELVSVLVVAAHRCHRCYCCLKT